MKEIGKFGSSTSVNDASSQDAENNPPVKKGKAFGKYEVEAKEGKRIDTLSDDGYDSSTSTTKSLAEHDISNTDTDSGEDTSYDSDAKENFELTESERLTGRIDKRVRGLPYTKVLMKGVSDGEDIEWVRLLNTVPEKLLQEMGFQKQELQKLPHRDKNNEMSDEAVGFYSDTPEGITSRAEGLYFGEGNFGSVKFASLTDPVTGEEVICAAKKIKINKGGNEGISGEKLKHEILKEIQLQQQAGEDVSPYIYGYSETVDKEGNVEFIIFMEQAIGQNATDYITKLLAGEAMTTDSEEIEDIRNDKQLIMTNLLKAVQLMHDNGVYHRDIKWDNIHIDPVTKRVQILDYGMATSNPEATYDSHAVACYMAPEAVSTKKVSSEKMDIFSTGVLLIDLFSMNSEVNPFLYMTDDMVTTWTRSDQKNKRNLQKKIDDKLDQVEFENEVIRDTIASMLHANPDKRMPLFGEDS